MQTGISELAEDLKRSWDRLIRLGLERNIAEIHALGYTVIEPEKTGADSFVSSASERILQLAKEEGAEISDYTTYQEGLSYELYHLVKRGRVFEQMLVNPVALAIGWYLLGENMILNNSLAYVKGETDDYLRLHSDSLMFPDPLPDYLHLINCTFALTDYTLEGGCIGVVPGSHRYRRHPTAAEAIDYSVMEPIECPAGSLIIMPGNTWHGAFPKKTKQLRVTLVQAYSRMYLAPTVTHDIDKEIMDRNDQQFHKLLGAGLFTGIDEHGLDMDKFNKAYRSQRSLFA